MSEIAGDFVLVLVILFEAKILQCVSAGGGVFLGLGGTDLLHGGDVYRTNRCCVAAWHGAVGCPAFHQTVQHIQAGEEVSTAEEVDTTRKTTKESGERFPQLILPNNNDFADMSISAYMTKKALSNFIFESLGYNNAVTGWSDWIMVKTETHVGDGWYVFNYGEDERFAESVTEAAEGTEGARHADIFEFEIYDYIHDWDGNEITADDVVFSYSVDIASGKVFKYQSFIWCEAIDTYKVRFYMDYNEMQTLNPCEHPFNRFTVFSQKGYESGNYDSSPVATGPYKLVSFVSGSEAVVEADDNYWQDDESLSPVSQMRYIQTIRIPIIKEAEQRINALATGAADIGSGVSTDDLELFTEGGPYADRYNIYRAASSTMYGVIYNCYEGHPGNDINFRIALSYALNSESVAIGAGTTYFALKGFGSNGQTDFDPSLDEDVNWQTQYDLAKAQEYLQKAKDAGSYNGESLSILCSTNEAQVNMAQVMQGLWEVLGVKTEINSCESNQSEAYLPDPSKWDIYLFGTMGGSALVAGINRPLGRVDFQTEPHIGYADSLGFQNDDELYRLFKNANTQANAGAEATAAMSRYIVENAYMKACCGTYTNYVYTNKCAELVFTYKGGEIAWNACNYYLD